MNVRKRGLALLMCICMIFTLLPFSAFADASSDDSVVYGQYDNNGKWKQVANAKDTVTYPVDNQGNTVTLKKTATPTGNKNEYKIDLEVITTETSSTKAGDAATVLVIDVSSSMKRCAECGREVDVPKAHKYLYDHAFESRIAAAQTAAKQFIDAFKSDSARRYVSVVSFSTDSRVACEWKDVSTAAGYKAVKAAIDGLKADGGTNLDAGLQTANTQLSKTTVASIKANAKNVIALTDGMPTFYVGGDGKNGNHGSTGCPITNYRTEASATTLKNSAALYTVCFGAASDKCWSDWVYNKRDKTYEYGFWPNIIICSDPSHAQDGPTVGDFLRNSIATPAADGKTYAYNADKTKDLLAAFKSITDTITEGISAGTVKDGLPTGVSPVGSAPTAFVENTDGTYSWELIPANAEQGTDGGKTTYTYKVSYVVELDTTDPEFNEDIYHALNTETTFTAGGKVYKFNVPGVKGESPKCTVTYNKGDHGNLAGQDTDGNVVRSSVKLGSATPKAPDVTPDNGWYFTGWDKDIAPTVTEDVTYTAQYAEKKTITVTAKSDTAEYNGSERLVNGFETLEFAIDGETYTVSGLTASASGIDANDYVSKVEGTAVVKDSSGKDVTERFTVNTVDGKLTITPKTVTLTGESAARTYTGKEIELTGITPVGLLDGHKLSGVSYSAKGTDASATPYPGKFSDKDKLVITDAAGNDVTTNYNVEYKSGALTIEPIGTVIVTIKGNTDSKVYNGTEQSVTGFTVVSISDTNYKATDFSLKVGVEAKATGTNASDTAYPMGLTADSFVNNNSNFKNVTFVVEDGSLTITKRPLTIEGQSSEPITYDGQTHSFMDWWPVTATDNTGLVSGHEVSGISYLLTGKDAGSYTGEFSGDAKIMSGEENVTENYSIEYTLGKMKIVPAERIAVKIIGNHEEVWYNGQEQSVSGFTFDVADNTVTVELKDGHYAIAKGTNVKTYYMGLKSDDFTINHKNYKEVSVEIVDGYLTIKRHYTPNPPITDKITVEITGNSDSVVYDGTEHSVKDYTVKISDSRYTEKDFTFSGKALASGVNAGTYEMGLKAEQFKNTNARFTNVKFVIKADGVLTITQRPLTITAGSAEGIAPVTCDKYTVEGLATGDKVDSVKITGIQSEPGESPNVASDAVIKNAKGEDVTANYKITYVDGVLKAIEVLNKEIHFNYVIGYTDGTIRPNNNISRAEVATIFFRLLTDEARTQYDKTTRSFSDIKDGAWCCRAVSTLTNMGIIKGYTDGTFQPNKSITRAELATIIARFAKLDVNTKTFSDINGHWAQKSIELAAGNGWINGYTDGTFRPNKSIIRAETFAMINRVLNRQTESVSDLLPTSEMNMWSDNLNENAWYYKDVQEATNYHKCDRVGDSVYEKWTEKVPDIDWASYQI